MADSNALRSRRRRLHAQGDHSICRHDRPVRAAGSVKVPDVPADNAEKLRWLAEVAAEAYKADPGNAALARELRATLQALQGLPVAEEPDELDLLRARRRDRLARDEPMYQPETLK